MSEWWEAPYKGGPLVPVPGFPRPLYPPDAVSKGKTPSVNGPDVEAYKRTCWRAGRWQGPASNFDRAFSNAFSHGKSGNVGESGIAGVQRQQGIDPTGWVGQATFNTLRSIRVPTGPHAGEMAMDENAANLIAQAWQLYGGNEPSPEPPAPTVGKLTRKAIPSPNFSSRGGATVRLIVLHTAEGSTTIESLGNYFASSSSGVSSHVGIDDKDGVIGEYVRRGDKAWTAANANPVAVQVELCAFAKWSAAEWAQHPNMLENTARWIAEEAAAFGLPITKLSASQAQGSGRGVCQHADLGSWGGGHWDCGGSFPIEDVLNRAKELA
jgi:N-acetylmuramoyl-L-alanine amidase